MHGLRAFVARQRLAAALPFAPTYATVLACAGLATFCFSLPQAMFASALQLATPNRMRGVVSSLWVFIASGPRSASSAAVLRPPRAG